MELNYVLWYSSCTVDNESNSPHTITDHLSDDVTLAVADSTTPEVDRDFEKVWEQLNIICSLCVYEGQIKFKEKRDVK